MGAGAERVTDRSQTKHQDERRRVTVSEAADILGITAEAVRTRIKRGRLDSVKVPPQPGGTVYVLLEADQTGPNGDPTSQVQDQTDDQTPFGAGEELVDELRDKIRYLERQVEEERDARRRADTLLAQLMQRIPELEPPGEPRESPESPGPTRTPTDAGEGLQTATERPFTEEEGATPRRWWEFWR